MIHLSASVRKTAGGLWRARVSGEFAGVQRWRDSERVCWSISQAWGYANALRVAVAGELVGAGYMVAP